MLRVRPEPGSTMLHGHARGHPTFSRNCSSDSSGGTPGSLPLERLEKSQLTGVRAPVLAYAFPAAEAEPWVSMHEHCLKTGMSHGWHSCDRWKGFGLPDTVARTTLLSVFPKTYKQVSGGSVDPRSPHQELRVSPLLGFFIARSFVLPEQPPLSGQLAVLA